MNRRKKQKKQQSSTQPKTARSKRSRTHGDELLIDTLDAMTFADRSVLCTSLSYGQFAEALARRFPETGVVCNFLDLYQTNVAQRSLAAGETENLSFTCEADFPDEQFDVVALPFRKGDSSELTRELIQSGYQTLRIGGRLMVSFDNIKDHWIHELLRSLFPKVTRRPSADGVVYIATKRAPLKKVRDYFCEITFRDGDRLIRAVSRPGVFSHRKLDNGARALIKSMQVEDGFRVLDLGCGSGAVALAAAARAENVRVHAIDSAPRALQCTRMGAELNNLTGITTQLDADGNCDDPKTFDLVLGNPPYFSNYRIASIFVRAGIRALKPGGTLAIVTKTYDWFGQTMSDYQDDVVVHEVGNYFVVTGIQR